jgi:hypothetical protein
MRRLFSFFSCCSSVRNNDENVIYKDDKQSVESGLLSNYNKDVEDFRSKKEKKEDGIIVKNIDVNPFKIPQNMIRPEENMIIWSREGLIDFVKQLSNLDNYEQVMKDDNYILFKRVAGSPLTDKINLTKYTYSLKKDLLPPNFKFTHILDMVFLFIIIVL